MFNELYKLGEAVGFESDSDSIFGCAASNGERSAAMITYYNDDDSLGNTEVKLELSGIEGSAEKNAKLYLLDREHDMELVREEKVTPDTSITLDMPLFGTYLIVVE